MEAAFVDKHYDLVLAGKAGEVKAYEKLYKLYSVSMLNTAYRIIGTIEDAEDVLQESFVVAFNKLATFRQETTFGLWLKTIVINRAVTVLRKRKMEWVPIMDEHLDMIPFEDNELYEEELQFKVFRVKEAISKLPDGYRVVSSLHLLEGYDHEEISSILHINENTARVQYSRAKRKLLETLSADEVFF
jgi:RNA polymerase sigma factor (sigma-70 family)